MAIQRINTGTNPNDGTGDPNRVAWQKGNANFVDLDARADAAQASATDAGAAAAAAQSSATSAGGVAAAAQTAAAAANTNANSRVLSSARDAAGGVANINAMKRLPYALETALRANSGNYGRSLVNPDGLFYSNNVTGAFIVRMTNTTAMSSVRVRIYNYSAGLVEFVAMLYATGSAIPIRYLSHLGTLKVPVRFAMETATNRRVMIIGDVGTAWGFPSINIMDAVSHRTGIVPGAEPYDCDLVTSLDAFSQINTVEDTGPYATAEAALALAQGATWAGYIPSGTDLNTITTPGVYSIQTNAIAISLINAPPGWAHAATFVVKIRENTPRSVTQEILSYFGTMSASRGQTNSTTWAVWNRQAYLNATTGKLNSADLPDIILDKIFGATGQATATPVGMITGTATDTTVGTYATGLQIGGGGSNASLVIAASAHTTARLGPRVVGARTTAAAGVLTTALPNNMTTLSMQGLGADGVDTYRMTGEVAIMSDGVVSPTSSPGRIDFRTTPVGSVIPGTSMALKSTQLLLSAGVQLAVGTGGMTCSGTAAFTGPVTGITKAMVGLPNVDNTPDTGKPVSAAQAAALALKFNLAGGTITGATAFSAGVNFNNTVTLGQIGGGVYSNALVMYGGGYIRGAATNGGGMEIINNANSERNFFFRDDGVFMPRQAVRIETGNNVQRLTVRGFGANQGEGASFEATVGGLTSAIVFRQSGLNVCGTIQTNDSQTFYNTTSDYRLKNEVGPMVGARDRLKSLRVFLGEFKASPGEVRAMMFAHEIQEWMPHAVTGRKDAMGTDGKIEPQQVDYSALVPDLIAALIEEMAITDRLRSTLLGLQAQQQQHNDFNAALAARVETLEAK